MAPRRAPKGLDSANIADLPPTSYSIMLVVVPYGVNIHRLYASGAFEEGAPRQMLNRSNLTPQT